MTFPYTTTRFTSQIETKAAPEKVLAVLNQPQQWYLLNPLVLKVEQDPAEPDVYYVTDKLMMMGRETTLRYKTKYQTVTGGADIEVWSPMNVRLNIQWRINQENGFTLVSENVQIRSLFFLSGYVTQTAQQAHRVLMGKIKHSFEK